MIQQEQLAPFRSSPSINQEDLIPFLEQPDNHDSFILGNSPTHCLKEEQEHGHIYPQKNQPPFHLSLLQNEQSNHLLPQKFIGQAGEEDQILMNLAPSTNAPSPPLNLKKQCKIDRNAYLEESRKVKIDRYIEKKHRRIWDRKIFYDCRKVVADNRERVNGRFVKKSPIVKGDSSARKTSTISHEQQQLQIPREFELQGKGFEDFLH